MYWSLRDHKTMSLLGMSRTIPKSENVYERTPSLEAIHSLSELLNRDPLSRLFEPFTAEQKATIKICRHTYKTIDTALETFLEVLDPRNPEDMREGYKMMRVWKWPLIEQCIIFLDVHFSDEMIRLKYVFKR
jgi:hypothetical protein